MGETFKLKERLERQQLYGKWIKGHGIDIGCGRLTTGADLIHPDAIAHDKDDCDATTMCNYGDNRFDYVYSSHVIEHLDDPKQAIANWVRICRPKGFVIIYAPHRDLYEGRTTLPSQFNPDHRYFIHPTKSEPPCTYSFIDLLNVPNADLMFFEVANDGWSKEPSKHAGGEYSVLGVIQKH